MNRVGLASLWVSVGMAYHLTAIYAQDNSSEMALEVSTGVEDADDEHVIGFDGVEDGVGFVRVAIEARAQIVGRHPDARELPEEFKAALEREVVFQGLRQTEGGDAVVADGFNVGWQPRPTA